MSNLNYIIMKKLLDLEKPWEPSQAGVVLAQEIINQYGYSKGPVWFMDLRDKNLKQVAEKINSPLCQFFHDKESREKVSYHIWKLCMDWQQYYAVNNVLIKEDGSFDKDYYKLITDFVVLRELERLLGDEKKVSPPLLSIPEPLTFGNNTYLWDEKGRFCSQARQYTNKKSQIPQNLWLYNHSRNLPGEAFTYNYQAYAYGSMSSYPGYTRASISDKDKAKGYIGMAYPSFKKTDKNPDMFAENGWVDGLRPIVICQKLQSVEEIIPRLLYYLLEDIANQKIMDSIARPAYTSKGNFDTVEFTDTPLPYPKVLLSQHWKEGKIFFPLANSSSYYNLPPNFPNHKIAKGGYPIKLPQAIIDMANTKEPYWHRLCPPEPWKFHWWDKQGNEHFGGITYASIKLLQWVSWYPYFADLEYNL